MGISRVRPDCHSKLPQFLYTVRTVRQEYDIMRSVKNTFLRFLSALGFRTSNREVEEKLFVAQRSRGNVRLQRGQIMTEREYARQREKGACACLLLMKFLLLLTRPRII